MRLLSVLFATFIFLVVQSAVNADSVDLIADKMNRNFYSLFHSDYISRLFAITPNRNPKKIDLLFVMDNSGSIGSTAFVKQKTFVSLVIDHSLTVTCTTSIRIAVISFANSAQTKVEFDFDDHSTSTPRADLKRAVNASAYAHGPATNTGRALDLAHSLLNDPSRGARSDATKIVFVLTDGKSNEGDAPGPKADILRNRDGAVVFAMGVANFGSTSSQNELRAIATNPDKDYVLNVEDFDDMGDIASHFGASTSVIN
jgi:hypothetical protein